MAQIHRHANTGHAHPQTRPPHPCLELRTSIARIKSESFKNLHHVGMVVRTMAAAERWYVGQRGSERMYSHGRSGVQLSLRKVQPI